MESKQLSYNVNDFYLFFRKRTSVLTKSVVDNIHKVIWLWRDLIARYFEEKNIDEVGCLLSGPVDKHDVSNQKD